MELGEALTQKLDTSLPADLTSAIDSEFLRRSRETGLRIAASRSCESGLSGGSRRRRRRQKHKRHGAAPLDIEPILNDNCGNNTDNALHEQLALLFRENARLQALLKRREASVAQKLSDAQSIAKAITAEQHRTNRIIADLQEKLGRANRFNQHLRKTMGEKAQANAAAHAAALELKTAYFTKQMALRDAEFRVALQQSQKQVETAEARVRLKEQEIDYIDKYNLLRVAADEKRAEAKRISIFLA